MTTVTRARWWHVGGMAALELELFPDDPWSTEQFWQELSLDTRHYLVALDDGGLVGYAGLFALAPDGDVQTVAVRSDRQGGGVATSLVRGLLEEADRRGCRHVMLEVRAANERAITLYERFGFETISTRRRYYPDGADALIMRRPVGAGEAQST